MRSGQQSRATCVAAPATRTSSARSSRPRRGWVRLSAHPSRQPDGGDSSMAVQERTWVGKSVNRREDPRILAGRGTYVDDIKLPGLLHAAVLRSTHAHARIKSIDTSAARRAPGVVAVLTGPEALEYVSPMPAFCAETVVQHAVATERVRFVGEAVAAVAATSRYAAEDACQLISVEYEPLPAASGPNAPLQSDAPRLHDTLESNVVFERV